MIFLNINSDSTQNCRIVLGSILQELSVNFFPSLPQRDILQMCLDFQSQKFLPIWKQIGLLVPIWGWSSDAIRHKVAVKLILVRIKKRVANFVNPVYALQQIIYLSKQIQFSMLRELLTHIHWLIDYMPLSWCQR